MCPLHSWCLVSLGSHSNSMEYELLLSPFNQTRAQRGWVTCSESLSKEAELTLNPRLPESSAGIPAPAHVASSRHKSRARVWLVPGRKLGQN